MAKEILTGYAVYDDNECVSPQTYRMIIDYAELDWEYHVTSDKGAAHFSGDFFHTVDIKLTQVSAGWRGEPWGLSNTVDDFADIDRNNGDCLFVAFFTYGSNGLTLQEIVAGTPYSDSNTTISVNTYYYLEIERDEDQGTYGKLICRIYDDSGRTNLIDTLEVTLHEKEDFRYVHCGTSWKTSSTANTYSAVYDNLDLHETVDGGSWYYNRKRRAA